MICCLIAGNRRTPTVQAKSPRVSRWPEKSNTSSIILNYPRLLVVKTGVLARTVTIIITLPHYLRAVIITVPLVARLRFYSL